MDEQSCRSQLQEWMREIVPYSDLDRHIRETTVNEGFRVIICTEENTYSISVHLRAERAPYLGCIASARKQRAGENWTRGNDLPDGEFSRATWDAIVNAIVRYELVKLEPPYVQVGMPITTPPISMNTGITTATP